VRVLFVTSRFPYPLVQGDRLRGHHQLRILSRRHSIVLITPQPERNREDNLKAIRPFCEQIEVVFAPPWRSLWRLGRTPFTSLPLQTLYFFDPGFRQRAQTLLQKRAFDLVHVQLARMAPVVERLANLPKVIDLVDALSLNMTRRVQRERGVRAWIAAFEARRLQLYERALTQQYDELIVSSELDRQAIGEYNNLHVIPNGVDTEACPFIEDSRESNTIVFAGRMGYFPNADAAIWFATEVFPLVRQEAPQARFLIVGADPYAAVRRLGRCPGVVVTRYVPRIQDYLTRATVVVAPMQAGSGIQNKVLEAMACGAPVVATPYALGGIEANDSEHLLVARDREAFAGQVVRIMKDRTLALRLARNARQLVKDKYTWDRSVAMLEQAYCLAMSQRN